MLSPLKLRRTVLVSLVLPLGLVTPAALAQSAGESEEVAKIVSIQNLVESKSNQATAWQPSKTKELLFENSRVRTGAASRAAILYSDKTLHRMNEKSELEVLQPSSGSRSGVLKVLSGSHYFSSRKPKDYGRVETPTVTAAIKGTEFAVDVASDGTTTISMLEGVVEASNDQGAIDVSAGEQAYIEPGKAPVRRVLVRPRDAVSWTLYYPPVLGGGDATRLEGLGREGNQLAEAAQLLSSGQVQAARTRIDRFRESRPDNATAMALASVLELVRDEKAEARRLADAALAAQPDSAAAALAVSFAAQAQFDIRLARKMAKQAADRDPENSAALARAAELAMAEGDTERARYYAERALRRQPNDARALSVMGFVQLAEYRTPDAEETFRRAVDSDPALPLARVGLGISQIRRGQLNAGREELQTAAILDPGNSLYRSYLGKAYYEEKRYDEASTELALAKELDPSDPTPHLYDAILKQTYNRPIEALADLQTSLELNDQRAVYRSRLLLDQDRATRGADVARVYNDLGFEQLGVVSARRSADQDQSNHSAHMLLAGTYRNLPDFAPAFLSEVLQARIYQPVSTNAARPDIVNESVSFNEYTALFDRQRPRGFASFGYGDVDTDIEGLYEPGAMCADPINGGGGLCSEIVSIDDSSPANWDLTGTINGDRYAAAVTYQKVETDGFRVNTDTDRETWRVFATVAPTYRDTLQFNIIRSELNNGDLPLRDQPYLITPERFDVELDNWAVGYHRVLSPAADLAISAIYNRTESLVSRLDSGATGMLTFEGPQLEAQYVRRQANVTWIGGAGVFAGEQETDAGLRADDEFKNAYGYAKIRDLGDFELTLGLAVEDVVAPTGLFPPRDTQMTTAAIEYDETQVSPKLGAAWYAGPRTVFRLAAFSRLSPAIGRLQSLEPTQVNGFNQFFGDEGGTQSDTFGVGWDQSFGKRFFAGIGGFYRDLTVPEASCENPNPFDGCNFDRVTEIVERDAESRVATAYFNATIGRRVSVALDYAYDERDFEFTQVNSVGQFEDYVRTQRLTPQVRAFFPGGFFVAVGGSGYDQRIEFTQGEPATNEDFWIVDGELGYRGKNRLFTASLKVLNATDEKFPILRQTVETQLIPARRIVFAVTVQN